MARSVLVDSGYLVALVRRNDSLHPWAADVAGRFAAPWHTCEAVLSETFFLTGPKAWPTLAALLLRHLILCDFHFAAEEAAVLTLMAKYASVPMSFADACLVRMTEVLPDPVIVTADTDFRIYRRHSRQVVPCLMP